MTKLEKIKDFCFSPKDMQLKAIKHYPSMSEETYCYEANLYILDTKICRVTNRGRGSCDDFDFFETNLLSKNYIDYQFIQDLDNWCKKHLPKWHFEYKDEYVPKSLEVWCNEQLSEHIDWKDFKKAMSKSVLYLLPTKDTLYEFVLKPTKDNIKRCLDKFPNHTILQAIPQSQAFDIYMEKTK